MTTAHDMDRLLWRRGTAEARRRKRAGIPHELDYLRGMHEAPALVELARWLKIATGMRVNLTSIWCDKHAYVFWERRGARGSSTVIRRELADLAVLVRKRRKGKLHTWMWVIQGKKAEPFTAYGGRSTADEILLLQTMPEFFIPKGARPPIKLKDDFPSSSPSVGTRAPLAKPAWPSPLIPWTFLDFHPSPSTVKSAVSRYGSPLQARWPGKAPTPRTWAWGTPIVSRLSYCDALAALVRGVEPDWIDRRGSTTTSFAPGAPVSAAYPEWLSLYRKLMLGALGKSNASVVSKGNPSGSILQLAMLATKMPGGTARGGEGIGSWSLRDEHDRALITAVWPDVGEETLRIAADFYNEFDIPPGRGSLGSDDDSGGPGVTLIIDVLDA